MARRPGAAPRPGCPRQQRRTARAARSGRRRRARWSRPPRPVTAPPSQRRPGPGPGVRAEPSGVGPHPYD
ncbi:hypothetical protein BKD26_33455 [Streptomyces sp. CB03238]|nr:hypothetical protein BKD26_33455 [Streptomyces sp. CB03238]